MKKILLTSGALSILSLSIVIFQISCQKEVQAQSGTSGVVQQNKIIFYKSFASGDDYYGEIWTANYDGRNQKKIAITLPAGIVISERPSAIVSPDGSKLFFSAGPNKVWGDIYSCNIDGGNAVKIVTGGEMTAAY